MSSMQMEQSKKVSLPPVKQSMQAFLPPVRFSNTCNEESSDNTLSVASVLAPRSDAGASGILPSLTSLPIVCPQHASSPLSSTRCSSSESTIDDEPRMAYRRTDQELAADLDEYLPRTKTEPAELQLEMMSDYVPVKQERTPRMPLSERSKKRGCFRQTRFTK